ncbi:hypothetical protein [Streptomyces erythrochromogenes]|uniref:hypothetical protein n=1 Tax=Streptomyces erythrochromogenes TaxID=285574 RepID=UPI00343607D6
MNAHDRHLLDAARRGDGDAPGSREDHDGVTPYEHAARRGFDGMAGILRAAGAQPGAHR